MGIQPKQDDKIREVNFFSGYELLPFPPNSTTFGPVLSNAAIAARRAFYLFSLPTFFDKIKEDQKHRMVYYTVLWSKKNQEVDKMQRMSPLDGGDDNSGSPSECYRSQRISTILQDDWDKKNFPPDLPDYQDKQFGDVNTMMWNKHVSCTCAEFGIQAGCIKMDLKDERLPQQEQKSRADGDWRYAEFEVPLCNWPEGILPSAFVNMYTFPACLFGLPPDGLRKQYKGLQDADDELPDS